MAVTIKDIVKETGLGAATISAYLNNVPVREYNREKIERAIKKLGYIRNEYARGLKTHESKTIGVLIPELSNIFATTIISEMEEVLRDKGYGIIVCDCRTNVEFEQNAIKFLLSKMVDGLIIMPVTTDGKTLDMATDKNIPVVVIDRMTSNDKVSHITINNKDISKEAVNILLDNKHKRIALITGDMNVYTASQRRMGYQEALEEKGCFDESLIYSGGLCVRGGYQAVKHLLYDHSKVDGIFVTNYEMTVGSIIALGEVGLTIGKDIAFVGFDSLEMSEVSAPKLVTVNQPLKEIGQIAAMTIIAAIAGKPAQNVELKAVIK